MVPHVFLKQEYSEWVVRNSLYWMSSVTTWRLNSREDAWEVFFDTCSDEVVSEFNRLLNDYCLREMLDKRTIVQRSDIAESVLSSIELRLKR